MIDIDAFWRCVGEKEAYWYDRGALVGAAQGRPPVWENAEQAVRKAKQSPDWVYNWYPSMQRSVLHCMEYAVEQVIGPEETVKLGWERIYKLAPSLAQEGLERLVKAWEAGYIDAYRKASELSGWSWQYSVL
mgnify:CR=1 FL=1